MTNQIYFNKATLNNTTNIENRNTSILTDEINNTYTKLDKRWEGKFHHKVGIYVRLGYTGPNIPIKGVSES